MVETDPDKMIIGGAISSSVTTFIMMCLFYLAFGTHFNKNTHVDILNNRFEYFKPWYLVYLVFVIPSLYFLIKGILINKTISEKEDIRKKQVQDVIEYKIILIDVIVVAVITLIVLMSFGPIIKKTQRMYYDISIIFPCYIIGMIVIGCFMDRERKFIDYNKDDQTLTD